tara:strand:- start:1763 stop:2143 length:381 start_codon:yes stop_codon:yes gene_type:complete
MSKDTYSEYWNGIEASIAEILEWARNYCESAEEAKEYVYAQISINADNNYWTIYTHASAKGLIHSDNENAIFDLGCEDVLTDCDSYGQVVSIMMHYAYEADLWERLPADWDSGIDELYAERSLSVA